MCFAHTSVHMDLPTVQPKAQVLSGFFCTFIGSKMLKLHDHQSYHHSHYSYQILPISSRILLEKKSPAFQHASWDVLWHSRWAICYACDLPPSRTPWVRWIVLWKISTKRSLFESEIGMLLVVYILYSLLVGLGYTQVIGNHFHSHSLLVSLSEVFKFVAGKLGTRSCHRWSNPNNFSPSPPKSPRDATSQQQAKATSNKHLSYVRKINSGLLTWA